MTARNDRRKRAQRLSTEIMDFKSSLVRQRKHMNLSQGDVAERMGISQSTVSDIERYDSNPTLKTILKYASAVEALLNLRVIDDCCSHTEETFAQMTGPAVAWSIKPKDPSDKLSFYTSDRAEFDLAK